MVDVSKHNSFEDNVRKLENLVKPQSLKDFFIIKYYKEDLSCEQIGNLLGISAASVRRYMKFVGVDLRNKNQVMKRLHAKTKGRKWTSEQAKKNVSEGVKRSYDAIDGLREKRSKDNIKTWNKMTEEEKENRYKPGLLVMHARKRSVKHG